MASEWTNIRDSALDVAKAELGSELTALPTDLVAQINTLSRLADDIRSRRRAVSKDEFDTLISHEQECLQEIIFAYKSMSLIKAKNAASAIVNVVLGAIPKVIGLT